MNTPVMPPYETGRAGTWETRVACRGKDPHLWDDEASAADRAEARRICLDCPVLEACLADTMAFEWGRAYARTELKAALNGRQRGWLHQQADGTYDVEQARRIALEAQATRSSVARAAEGKDVSGTTVRLAAKFLDVTVRDAVLPSSVMRVDPAKRADDRIKEIVAWRRQHMSLDGIARRIGVSRRTVKSAITRYEVENGPVEQVPSGVARGRRLSEEQVVSLRERAVMGGVPIAALARELGIARTTASNIVRGVVYQEYGGPLKQVADGGAKYATQPSAKQQQCFNGRFAPRRVAA